MVRRLKKDLRALGTGQFPHRRLIELSLEHRDGQWWQTRIHDDASEPARALGPGSGVELRLGELLAEYAASARPTTGRGRLVFVNLQKRLLSSVEAFFRTLHVHARTVGRALEGTASAGPPGDVTVARVDADDEEIYGRDDDDDVDQDVRAGSRVLADADARSTALLQALLELAGRHRGEPDAKAIALLDWIREHQCPAVAAGEAVPGASKAWSDRRLIVFTEYADTKRYLQQLLAVATAGTVRGAERVVALHGGMSDEAREEVQTAWNGDPKLYPARILLATDAAREGVNLQGHCADLVHFDVPWNPARLEQRNGRIDRTLQPSAEVRCMYFVQPQRVEDRVLSTLVRKVERIAHELGSLSQVVMDRIERVLADGIDDRTAARLGRAEAPRELERTVAEELLDGSADAHAMQRLRDEIDACGQLEEESRRQLELDSRLLKDAIDVSLELYGAGPLVLAKGEVLDFVVEEDERSWDPNKVREMREASKQYDLFADNTWRETFRVIPKLPYKFSYEFEDAAGRRSELQVLDWETGALYWNCLRSSNGDEPMALAKVRQKYFGKFLEKDLHFFLGTTQQWHQVAPNPWVIIGVLPIPHENQLGLF